MSTVSRGACLVTILAASGCAGGGGALQTFDDSASYAIGANLGASLREQAPDVRQEQLIRGLTEALEGQDIALEQTEMMALLHRYAAQAGEAQERRQAEEGQMQSEAGRTFLEGNGERPGVTTTASGLQYEIVRQGSGPRPGPTDVVSVHYRGSLVDGTEFDASDRNEGSVTFPLNQVIPGWTEGVQLMNVGSVYKLYVPGDLGYGARGAPPDIPPNATLVFELELVEIK